MVRFIHECRGVCKYVYLERHEVRREEEQVQNLNSGGIIVDF